MASTTLTRTVSSAGNRKTFTYSAWIKRSNVSSGQGIFGQGNRSSSDFDIRFESSGTLRIEPSGFDIKTNQVFRDTNGWYHIVVAIDTTQATSTDRVKIYVNGEQVTSLANTTYPSLNYDTVVNSSGSTGNVVLGDVFNATGKFNGSMAHVHLTDGTAYDADTFGETDSLTGIWKPKTAPSVTYGTNGFFLKFENSGAFGTDSSGNGNTFTVNGTMTQTIDTPSNVFATMNPLAMGTAGSLTFSNGNLTATNSSSGHRSVVSSLAVSSGKWYFEGKSVSTGAAYPTFGIFNADASFNAATYFTQTADGYGYNSNGAIFHNSGNLVTGLATWTDGDIIGVALDVDNDKIYFSKNGSWQNSADPSAGTGGQSITSGVTWYFAGHTNDGGTDPIHNYNFGNGYFGTTAVSSAQNPDDGIGIFEYDVPTGYRALCTKSINAEEYS